MNTDHFLHLVNGKKGQFIKLQWTRNMKPSAANKNHTILKSTQVVSRIGVDYENIQKVQDGRSIGLLPSENHGLPWGHWKVFPFVLEHKGIDYCRIYTTNQSPQCQYFLNGTEVAQSEIIPYLTPSDAKSEIEGHSICFTIKMQDLEEVG